MSEGDGLTMLRLILYVFVVIVIYYLIGFFLRGNLAHRNRTGEASDSEELVQDPYCQTYVSKRLAIKKKVLGKDRYFCKRECWENYRRDRKAQKA